MAGQLKEVRNRIKSVQSTQQITKAMKMVSAAKLRRAQDAIIQMRLQLLKAKNFAEADKIRDDLLAKGIQLKDGKDPATGERVTTWEVRR